jgi:hypothetical protein
MSASHIPQAVGLLIIILLIAWPISNFAHKYGEFKRDERIREERARRILGGFE